MANKINGLDVKPVRVAPGSAVKRQPNDATASTGSEAGAGADVQLTGAARSLAALETSLRAQPAIDEARVAAVKQRLDSGEYSVDPQRVADRLLSLESDLSRAAPLDRSPLK